MNGEIKEIGDGDLPGFAGAAEEPPKEEGEESKSGEPDGPGQIDCCGVGCGVDHDSRDISKDIGRNGRVADDGIHGSGLFQNSEETLAERKSWLI